MRAFLPTGTRTTDAHRAIELIGLESMLPPRGTDPMATLHDVRPDLVLVAPWEAQSADFINRLELEAPHYLARTLVVLDEPADSLIERLLRKRGIGAVVQSTQGSTGIEVAARKLLATSAAEDAPTLPEGLTPVGVYEPRELEVGETVGGRFLVRELLGTGGSAEVYRVLDQELQQELALKLLRHDSSVPQVEERFRQELRITRTLRHPNLVRTFDFGTHDDRLYFTMELLVGSSMQTLVKHRYRGPWPILGLDRMAEVARGLAAAHAAGVVHRDVKPDNVFLVDGGARAVITDFGVAKPAAQPMAHTLAGIVLGTLEYMAPERLTRDLPATPGADTWAMGVMLYLDWTGRLPFQAELDVDLVHLICHEEPTIPREWNPAMPESVQELIGRLLVKSPLKRLADAEVLAHTLEGLAGRFGGGPAS